MVTAPTNGAVGVIPAVLYYFMVHQGGTIEQVRKFLLISSAIGGIIKHRSAISGAEVGCQGEVGFAAAMAAMEANRRGNVAYFQGNIVGWTGGEYYRMLKTDMQQVHSKNKKIIP